MLTTFQDAVHHLFDYCNHTNTPEVVRDARRACQMGLRELVTARRWSYLYKHGRIATVAPYGTGTIAYTHTGGTYERQVTLTGGTWPTWAKSGLLVVSGVAYEVEDRKSGTVITLNSTTNPGADVAALTTYKIYRDTYTLPTDFLASDALLVYGQWGELEYIHPGRWIEAQVADLTAGEIQAYTFVGDPLTLNRMAAKFYPLPDAIKNIDFIYQRMPRALSLFEYKTGGSTNLPTVTTTSGSATVTGSSTAAFDSTMVNSIIRIKTNDATVASGPVESGPYGFDKNTYYVHERQITAVASATSITVDSTLPESLSGAKFVVSDPIDIEDAAMMTAFFRAIEKQIAMIRKTADKPDAVALYKEALIMAMESDSRSFAPRGVGRRRTLGRGWSYGADIV